MPLSEVRKLKRIVALCLVVLLLVFATSTPALALTAPWSDDFLHSRSFVVPSFYWLWGRGNCVWFVWECAWQKYGVQLSWVGDARNWIKLNGVEVAATDGTRYRLELSNRPEPDSIMVLQPEALHRYYHVKPEGYANLGHVAWVTAVRPIVFALDSGELWSPGWKAVFTLDSTVYPPEGWGEAEYHGCAYARGLYFWLPGMEGVSFLVFKKL